MACGEDVELLKMSLCSRRANRVIKVCGRDPSFFKVNADENLFDDLEKIQLLLLEVNHPNLVERLGSRVTRLDIRVSKVLELSFRISPFIDFTIIIDSISQIGEYSGCRKYLKFERLLVPFIFGNDELHTFWDDKVDGLQFFVNYFEKHIRLKPLCWKFESSVPDLRRHVCYLNSLPKESNDPEQEVNVRSVNVNPTTELSDSDYKYLMETVTHNFYGLMKTSEDFKFVGHFATQNLVLTKARWFTLDNLLECKCGNVRVVGSKLTNEQLNVFMQKLSTGKLYPMKSLSIGLVEKANFDVILRGINTIQNPPRYPGGHTIQGATGERARVSGLRREFILHKIDV